MTDTTILPTNANGVFQTSGNDNCGNWGMYQHITNGQVASALASSVSNQHVTNEANQTRALITAGFNAMSDASARALAVQLQDTKDEVAALKAKANASPSI